MGMFDFREEHEKEAGTGYVIHCETCGHDSIVGHHHKRYCPICGPNTVTNIRFTRFNGNVKENMHAVNISFELTLHKNVELLVGDKEYEGIQYGDTDVFKPDMKKALEDSVLEDFTVDYAAYDLDTDKVIADW